MSEQAGVSAESEREAFEASPAGFLRQIELARAEVQSWPQWKQDAYTVVLGAPGGGDILRAAIAAVPGAEPAAEDIAWAKAAIAARATPPAPAPEPALRYCMDCGEGVTSFCRAPAPFDCRMFAARPTPGEKEG